MVVLGISWTLSCPNSFPFHTMYQYPSMYQSRPVAQFLPYEEVQSHHHISNANYVSSYYKVSKTLKSFLGKVFAVHVGQNLWQRAPLSIPLPVYKITVSCFNILFHMQIATRFYVAPVSTSFLCDLYQSGPFRRSNAFCHSMKQAQNSISVPKIRCNITFSRNPNSSSSRVSPVSFQFFI
jgi:hypothetical protein